MNISKIITKTFSILLIGSFVYQAAGVELTILLSGAYLLLLITDPTLAKIEADKVRKQRQQAVYRALWNERK